MVTAGLLAIMAAALFPLLHMATQWGRYLYAAGSLILLAGRFVAPKVKDAPCVCAASYGWKSGLP